VIQHSSGQVLSRCVAFAEDQITGLQLIQRAGIEYQAQDFGSMGSAMCQLDREPSPAPADCFGSSRYWQYSHRGGGGWQAASTGASTSVLHDGDMDGWRYATGTGQTPGNLTIGSVCRSPVPSVAATHPAMTPAASRPAPAQASAPPEPAGAVSPRPQAVAPTGSPTPGSALASTGPPVAPPKGTAIGAWLLFGGAAALLVGLGIVNLRRRGP
jgi:hypothetical protein